MTADLAQASPLAEYLGSFGDGSAPAWLLTAAGIVLYWFAFLVPALVGMELLDRKLGADIQMRIGPNRSSPFGLFQFAADALKLVFKEDASPPLQESWLFRWGVVFSIAAVFSALANIPLAERWALVNLESGVAAVVCALGFSHLCLFWAAYSAGSPWAVLSGFRVVAMMSSYLAPLAISMIPPVVVASSLNLGDIVRAQGGSPWRWTLFHDPGAFLSGGALFMSLLIWTGRVPFDHALAQGEVAGGLAAEYSGLRKGLVAFLEYLSLLTACALFACAFLGGWRTPFSLEDYGRAAAPFEAAFFLGKTAFLALLAIWIRWSLPRLRIDQIINLSWRVMVPMGMTGALVSAVWLVVSKARGLGEFL